MALLRFDRQRGNRPRLKPAQRDGLACLLTIAVSAVVDPSQRLINLRNQLALAVACAQLNRTIGFGRRAVREIGVICDSLLEDAAAFPWLP